MTEREKKKKKLKVHFDSRPVEKERESEQEASIELSRCKCHRKQNLARGAPGKHQQHQPRLPPLFVRWKQPSYGSGQKVVKTSGQVKMSSTIAFSFAILDPASSDLISDGHLAQCLLLTGSSSWPCAHILAPQFFPPHSCHCICISRHQSLVYGKHRQAERQTNTHRRPQSQLAGRSLLSTQVYDKLPLIVM